LLRRANRLIAAQATADSDRAGEVKYDYIAGYQEGDNGDGLNEMRGIIANKLGIKGQIGN
jgi:hypothetical protein